MSVMATHVMGTIREIQKSYGSERSNKWREVSKKYLADHPACEVCLSRSQLNVHHIQPFHLRPDLELEPTNLITLCREDHILFGHLNSWKSFNPAVVDDCHNWRIKIAKRSY